jgi:hypothetical protein
MMGSRIGIALKEVGGASASGGLEAEGQEFCASCLSEAIFKRSAPESKGALSPLLIPTIPTFHVAFSKLRNLGLSETNPSRTALCMM